MATFGIDEANQLARQRTPGDVAAFISQFARRGPLAAAAAPRTATISAAPSRAAAAPKVAPKPMTQGERDDASVRDMRALAASVGMKGFEQQPATSPPGGSGGGDDDGSNLRRLAAAVGLYGFSGKV